MFFNKMKTNYLSNKQINYTSQVYELNYMVPILPLSCTPSL